MQLVKMKIQDQPLKASKILGNNVIFLLKDVYLLLLAACLLILVKNA